MPRRDRSVGAGSRAAGLRELETPFGQQLRQHRRRAGLSQAELAERAGLAASAIAALEGGARRSPYPRTLRVLAEALGLSAQERATFLLIARPPAPPAVAAALPPSGQSLAPPPRLPVPLTPLIGRDAELAAVGTLLDQLAPRVRLLTLVGTGGVGKTRFALQLAQILRARYPDGAWLVELASLADPQLVTQAVAATLGVREEADRALQDSLNLALEGRELLLVLDNCEHLVLACAELAERLLSACPRLTIVATSREPLEISGETVCRVAPLGLPPVSATTVADVGPSPAVRLFVERARSAIGDFELTEHTAASIAHICQQLDGLPLAIELAAARMGVLSLDQLEARLADRFRVLVGGSRTAAQRHQTVWSAVAWSYELLTERQQRVFERLAVFAGGCTLEAAEAVCSGPGLEPGDVLEELSELAKKSLVVVDRDPAGAVRFHLLETVRDYGRRQLTAHAGLAAVQRRHAEHFHDLACTAESSLTGRDQRLWLDRLEREHDNFRAALGWVIEHHESVLAAELGYALWRFWANRGYLVEGAAWLDRLLDLPDPGAARRLRLLFSAGMLAKLRRDFTQAHRYFEEARTLGDQEALPDLLPGVLTQLGILMTRRDPAAARALHEEALALRRAQGDRRGEAISLTCLGDLVWRAGDLAGARVLVERGLRLKREVGDDLELGHGLRRLALLDMAEGQFSAAHARFCQALAAYQQAGDQSSLATLLGQVGTLFLRRGELERAVRLLGAAQAAAVPLGMAEYGIDAQELALARAALGEPRASMAWAAGQALSLDAALQEALGPQQAQAEAEPELEATGPRLQPGGLTQRETEVLRLLAAGQPNHAIAATLALSVRTVERHITNLYAKIGASNKAEATAFALRHGVS